MKTNFSEAAEAIWTAILGNRTYLNPRSKEIVTNAIIEELGLSPVMVRYDGEDIKAFDHTEFLRRQPAKVSLATRNDDWGDLYYSADDCEAATGSKAANWTQWASRLLKYGRDAHRHANKIRPPADVLEALQARGQMTGRNRIARFISLEMVVFYIAAQTVTWSKDPHAIIKLKDRMRGLGIDAVTFAVPTAQRDAVDVDGILLDDNDLLDESLVDLGLTDGNGVTNRVPKAGQGLVAYNPTAQRQPVNAPLAAAGVSLDDDVEIEAIITEIEASPVAPAELDDDDLEAEISRLQSLLEERKARTSRAAFLAEAKQGQVLGGEVWPDRGEWATMQVQFPNGNTVVFYHQHFMAEQRATDPLGDDAVGFDAG